MRTILDHTRSIDCGLEQTFLLPLGNYGPLNTQSRLGVGIAFGFYFEDC